MSNWKPISEPPPDGSWFVLFHLRLDVGCDNIAPHIAHSWRANIGYMKDGVMCYAQSGHDVFEGWQNESQFPTHYMLLTAPPFGGDKLQERKQPYLVGEAGYEPCQLPIVEERI